MKVGFDVGGTTIKSGVVNEKKQLVAKRSISFPLGISSESIVKAMEEEVKALAKELQINPADFESIGIATAGSIDPEGEIILEAHNLGFHHVPMKAQMEKLFPGMPIFLANDADAAAVAELHAGAIRGYKTAVLLTLGTGVGGGLILDGKLFRGGMGRGVELGHMIIDYKGLLCSCGGRGCVETLCSATWIAGQGKKAASQHPESMLSGYAAGESKNITAKDVIECARRADPVAKQIFAEYIDQLSAAIVSLVVLLDPEIIVLGGGVSLAGDFLLRPLRELVNKKSFFRTRHNIVTAELGNDAGIIGAALLCRSSIH